jgi:hypothetical protein
MMGIMRLEFERAEAAELLHLENRESSTMPRGRYR